MRRHGYAKWCCHRSAFFQYDDDFSVLSSTNIMPDPMNLKLLGVSCMNGLLGARMMKGGGDHSSES